MGFINTLKQWAEKGTKKLLDSSAQVGTYLEDTSANLIEKVPGGHDLKEKASHYAEKTVNRIGEESKEIIKEGEGFIKDNMKKAEDAIKKSHTEPVKKDIAASDTSTTVVS